MPVLPPEVQAPLEAALTSGAGRTVQVRGTRFAGGGCIHNALSLDTTGGPVFLKWNRGREGIGFVSEAHALQVLRVAAEKDGLLAVPRVLDARDAGNGTPGWLALEYLPPSDPSPDHASRLGEGLALLHGQGSAALGASGVDSSIPAGSRTSPPTSAFGWFETNRIGPLEQRNPWTEDWATFWRDHRLAPQLEAAYREGSLRGDDRAWSDPLLEAVAPALEGVDGAPPALLHGDLWSGNVHAGPDGRPVLVDPAAYLGQGEVDLAMARLFGGFGTETFRRYREVRPAPPGFEEIRLPMYQLYYLLVHVRLFGSSYLGATRRSAEAVLRSVS